MTALKYSWILPIKNEVSSLLFAARLGYKVVEVPINHRRRLFGKSKSGLVKYLRIIYDLILIMLLFSGSGRIKKM